MIAWSASARADVRLHEDCDLRLARPAVSDAGDEIGERVGLGLQSPTVEAEERKHGDQPGPLVTVHERMIAHDIEQVRRCHLVQTAMEEHPPERCRRNGDGGLEQIERPDTRPASIPADLIGVEREDLVVSGRRLALLGETPEDTPILCVRLCDDPLQRRTTTFVAYG